MKIWDKSVADPEGGKGDIRPPKKKIERLMVSEYILVNEIR